jgi:hypothetical protein
MRTLTRFLALSVLLLPFHAFGQGIDNLAELKAERDIKNDELTVINDQIKLVEDKNKLAELRSKPTASHASLTQPTRDSSFEDKLNPNLRKVDYTTKHVRSNATLAGNVQDQAWSLAGNSIQDVTPKSSSTTIDKPIETPSTDSSTTTADKPRTGSNDANKPGGASLTSYLGAGVAVFLLPRHQVDTAVLRGGTVVITKERNHEVSAWLQANYVFDGLHWWNTKIRSTYPGIFAGLGAGPDSGFGNTFGIGGMLVFKRIVSKTSLNLGVGYYRTQIKTLADGIVAGQPLPAQFGNSIEYKDNSTGGLMLNMSFGFQ